MHIKCDVILKISVIFGSCKLILRGFDRKSCHSKSGRSRKFWAEVGGSILSKKTNKHNRAQHFAGGGAFFFFFFFFLYIMQKQTIANSGVPV